MKETPEGRAAEVMVAVGAGAPGDEVVVEAEAPGAEAEAEAEEVVAEAEAEEVVAEAEAEEVVVEAEAEEVIRRNDRQRSNQSLAVRLGNRDQQLSIRQYYDRLTPR